MRSMNMSGGRFRRQHPMSGKAGGLMFITLGVLLLLQQLHWQLHWRPDLDMAHLWPVLPMVFGAAHLFFPGDDGFAGGLVGLSVGVIFLLNNFHVVPISRTWPLFIVVGGVGVLIGSIRRSRTDRESEHGN